MDGRVKPGHDVLGLGDEARRFEALVAPHPQAQSQKVFCFFFLKKKRLLVSSGLVFPCQRAFDEFDRAFDAVEGDEAAEAGAFHLAEQDLV